MSKLERVQAKEMKKLEKEQAIERKRLEKKQKKERKEWEQRYLHREVRSWGSQIGYEKRRREEPKEDVWDLVKKGYKIIQIKKDTNTYRTLEEFKLEIISAPVDLESAFKEILKKVIDSNNLIEGDQIRMVVGHHNNDNVRPLSKKYQTIPGEDVENFILEHNESFLKFVEYKKIPYGEALISVYWFRPSRGKGRLKPTKKNQYDKRSIITIKNDDGICLARAIVTALANLRKTRPSDGSVLTETQLKNGFNSSRKLQEDEVSLAS